MLEPLKIRLWKLQGRKCAYCQRGLKRSKITIDHIVPTAKGGSNEAINKVACCSPCNQVKGDRTIAEWVDHILSVAHQQADLQAQVWKGLLV